MDPELEKKFIRICNNSSTERLTEFAEKNHMQLTASEIGAIMGFVEALTNYKLYGSKASVVEKGVSKVLYASGIAEKNQKKA